MEVNPLTVVAVVGVGSLFIERIFFYRAYYKRKNNNPYNPSPPVDYHKHGERIATLEEAVDNVEKNNDKDHTLIRDDIQKLTNLFNRKVFGVLNGMRK